MKAARVAVALTFVVCTAAFAQQASHPPPALPASQSAPATPGVMSLPDALALALQQVSALRQAEIDQKLAAADVWQAEAALLPRARDSFLILYNSPVRGTQNQSFLAQNAVHEYQNLLGVTGDLSFGVVAAIRRGRALLQAAEAGTEIARRTLVRGVNEAYYGAALATARRGTAEQSLAAAEEFQRVTALNFHAGEVPEVDVIRARLLTAARRDDLAQAREAEAIANASLGTLLGYGITRAPSIQPLPQTTDIQEIESMTAANVPRRAEFAQLEAQVRAARAEIGVSRGDLLPRIIYSVDEGFDTNSLSSADLRAHRGVLATAAVDLPIFDWGATRSRIRQAELRARATELQRQIIVRDLYLQFAIARQQATTAAERAVNARAAVADAERNVAVSVARYRAGEASIVEATDALTTLATQRLVRQQALFDYQIARVHLLEAAGR